MLEYNFSLLLTPRTLGRQSLDSIHPYVVPRSWVEHAEADALVTWQFSDDVWMVIVVDGRGGACWSVPHL